MITRLLNILVKIIILIILTSESQAKLNFSVIKITRLAELMIGGGDTVNIEGEISIGDTQRLAIFLEKERVKHGSSFYINSNGGNLLEGMKLGELLRSYEANTDIGSVESDIKDSTYHPDDTYDPNNDKIFGNKKYKNGVCFSACVLAYMGGKFRYLDEQDKIGVHQFYSEKKGDITIGDAQQISAIIATYLTKMEVSTNFLTYSSVAKPNELLFLTKNEATQMNIVNNGFTNVKWSTNSIDGKGLAIKGERDTRFGYQKVIFMCQNRTVSLMALFATMNHDTELKDMKNFITLDYGVNKLTLDPLSKVINNGWVIITKDLSSQQAKAIVNSDKISLMLQDTPESATFLGIGDFSLSENKNSILGMINVCTAN